MLYINIKKYLIDSEENDQFIPIASAICDNISQVWRQHAHLGPKQSSSSSNFVVEFFLWDSSLDSETQLKQELNVCPILSIDFCVLFFLGNVH